MNLNDAIKKVEAYIKNPQKSLPEEVFFFISRITPLVNVDLLIKDKNNRVLLSWRDDKYSGKGWHIPGGIVRYKETFEQRIQKVAINEIGTKVKFDSTPLTFRQIIIKNRRNRAHFISFLYSCYLDGDIELKKNNKLKEKDVGFLKWHKSCPKNLIQCHKPYKKFIK
jgi:colanic acid biosynthesis protein WcaH